MQDRFIRKPELVSIVGLSYPTIYRLEKDGAFPKRKLLAARAVGWKLSEVEQWVEERDCYA